MELIGREQPAPMNHIFRFYELRDYLRAAAETGYESIDLWTCGAHYFVDAHTYEETKKLKNMLRDYGLRAVSITPEQSCPKPFHMAAKRPEVRQKTEYYFKHMIQAASELECGRVLITSGWQFFSEEREEALKRSEEMAGELCRFAESYDVCLTMETLSSKSTRLCNTITDLKRMMKAVNSRQFGVTADIHTIHNAGESLQDWFDTFGDRINLVHFMDYRDGVFTHLKWGDGTCDLKETLKLLDRNGYCGPLILEYTDSRYFEDPVSVYMDTMKKLKPYIRK
ncbi:sugar phosphate isomerase/epimerase family protein [Anaerostipes sp.]|uniref:sugar phosphate isomerase/epimerase family protein n=1 Tax=Anaerostipes sp. TaxID=1872530 RepID=UPI0025BD1B28|nr:sugar phosphate isomerase/epimerase family protein [Anaerostipes sp.]MBS7009539.1 sugar phosphate isomerase/epimerase [Anaerostipes sp.]